MALERAAVVISTLTGQKYNLKASTVLDAKTQLQGQLSLPEHLKVLNLVELLIIRGAAKLSDTTKLNDGEHLQVIIKERTPVWKEVFVPWEDCWGLRGDPELFERLKNASSSWPFVAIAEMPDFLRKKILDEVEVDCNGSTRWPEGDSARLRDSESTAGMSGGYISLEFWEKTGVPSLVDRAKAALSNQKSAM